MKKWMPGFIVYISAFVICLLFKILSSMTTVTGGRYWLNEIFATIDDFLFLPVTVCIQPIFRSTWYDSTFADTPFGDVLNTVVVFLFSPLVWTLLILLGYFFVIQMNSWKRQTIK